MEGDALSKRLQAGLSAGLVVLGVLADLFSGTEGIPIPRKAFCPRISAAPKIDGVLDDPCWTETPAQNRFFVLNKRFFARARTEVKLVHNRKSLYIGIRAFSDNLRLIRTKATKRDGRVWTDDSVEVFLQPLRENAPCFHFIVNSAGTLYDSCSNVPPHKWNPDIRVASSKKALEGGAGYWCVEMAVPWEAFGGPPAEGGKWKANFNRTDSNRGELSTWMVIESGGFEQPSLFGELLFRAPTDAELAERDAMLTRLLADKEAGGESVSSIPLSKPTVIEKVMVEDCRVLRAFVGEPVDGCIRSLNYLGSVCEYPGRLVGAGINYSYNNNDGLHIKLTYRKGFNLVVLRGGASTEMYSNAELTGPGKKGRLLWKFPGGRSLELAYFRKKVNTDSISFFKTRAGLVADVSFYKVLRLKRRVGEPYSISDEFTLSKPEKRFAPESIYLGMEEFYDKDSRKTLALIPGNSGKNAIQFQKRKTIHLITEPFAEERGLDSVGIEASLEKETPCELLVTVHDPLNPRRDLTSVSVRLPRNDLSLVLDIPDQVLLKGSRVWISLTFDTDVTLGGKYGGTPLVFLEFSPKEDALPEAVEWRKFLMRTMFGQLSEPRPWSYFRKQSRDEFYAMNDYSAQCPEFFMTIDQCSELAPKDELIRQYREWMYLRNLKELSKISPPPAPPESVPAWAWYPRMAWLEFRKMVDWWMKERLVSTGEVGVGVGDDSDFYQQLADLPYFEKGGVARKVVDACERLAELAEKQNLKDGINIQTTDALHAYEEGINHTALMARWHYGDPIYLERCMVSARSIEKLTVVTEDGRRHFRNRRRMGYEDLKHPSKPAEDGGATALMWHTSLQLLDYNRNPTALKIVREWADSWLRFQKPEKWATVVEVATGRVISFSKHRPLSSGYRSQAVTFLWLYAMTGDKRYVEPFLYFLRKGIVPYPLNTLMSDVCSLGLLDELERKVVENIAGRFPIVRLRLKLDPSLFIQQTIGQPRNWHSAIDSLMDARRFPDMYTRAHQYTDRVFLGDLQARASEAYLGGFCKRNKYNPTLAVSWEGFGTDYSALVLRNRPDSLKAALYSFASRPMRGSMRIWRLEHGTYKLTIGTDTNGDFQRDRVSSESTVELMRADSIAVTLLPRTTTIIELRQEKRLDPIYLRPDLAISAREVEIKGSTLTATAHNIGSTGIENAVVAVVDRRGNIVVKSSLGAIPAPLNLIPRRNSFVLHIPKRPKGMKLVLDPDNRIPEIFEGNNEVLLDSLPTVDYSKSWE